MNAKFLVWYFLPTDSTIHLDKVRGSIKAIDALCHAEGALVCRIEIDSSDTSKYTILWRADATDTLHKFACRYAEEMIHLISEAHRPIFAAAIAAKRGWLRGEVTGVELGKARDAAWGAIWNGAQTAARAATMAAATDIVWATSAMAKWAVAASEVRAAGDAAKNLAWDDEWDNIKDAVMDAAQAIDTEKQNTLLESMLLELAQEKPL